MKEKYNFAPCHGRFLSWVCSGWQMSCSKCPALIPAHACHQYFHVVKFQRAIRWWIFDWGLSYVTIKLCRDNIRLKITWIMKICLFGSLNFDFGGHTQLSYKSRACVAFTEVGLTRAGCGSSGFCWEGWRSPKPTNTYCCTYGTCTKSNNGLCPTWDNRVDQHDAQLDQWWVF